MIKKFGVFLLAFVSTFSIAALSGGNTGLSGQQQNIDINSISVQGFPVWHSGNFIAGTDYQIPLVAGTDYQTPLVAGTDYQIPLVAGTDYQIPLVAGTDYQIPLVAGTDYMGLNGDVVRSDNTVFYSTDATGLYTSAGIEIQELDSAGAQTGVDAEAPALSLHWGGRVAGQLALHSDGIFHLRNGTTHSTNMDLRVRKLWVGETTSLQDDRLDIGNQLIYGNAVQTFLRSSSTAAGLGFQDSAGTTKGYAYADAANSVGFLDNTGNWNIRSVTGSGYVENRGISTGSANVSYWTFDQSDGTRDGFVGVSSGATRDVQVYADSGSVALYDAAALRLETNTNGVALGGSTNVSPSGTVVGQATFLGSGYSGYVALDANAMYVGHNSSARDYRIQTDETTRIDISGAGDVDIVKSLSIGSGEPFYLDARSNSYIQENAADNIRIVTGGVERLNANAQGVQVVGSLTAGNISKCRQTGTTSTIVVTGCDGSFVHTSTGVYTYTHNFGTTAYACTATPMLNGIRGYMVTWSSNTMVYKTVLTSTGAVFDSSFSIICISD